MSNSSTSSPRTLDRMTAEPVRAVPTGTALPATAPQSSVMVPKTPQLVLAYSSPRFVSKSKSPRSSPAEPVSPFFTAFTVEGKMEPEAKGISWAVSVSVMPWPRAPKVLVSGST